MTRTTAWSCLCLMAGKWARDPGTVAWSLFAHPGIEISLRLRAWKLSSTWAAVRRPGRGFPGDYGPGSEEEHGTEGNEARQVGHGCGRGGWLSRGWPFTKPSSLAQGMYRRQSANVGGCSAAHKRSSRRRTNMNTQVHDQALFAALDARESEPIEHCDFTRGTDSEAAAYASLRSYCPHVGVRCPSKCLARRNKHASHLGSDSHSTDTSIHSALRSPNRTSALASGDAPFLPRHTCRAVSTRLAVTAYAVPTR